MIGKGFMIYEPNIFKNFFINKKRKIIKFEIKIMK